MAHHRSGVHHRYWLSRTNGSTVGMGSTMGYGVPMPLLDPIYIVYKQYTTLKYAVSRRLMKTPLLVDLQLTKIGKLRQST